MGEFTIGGQGNYNRVDGFWSKPSLAGAQKAIKSDELSQTLANFTEKGSKLLTETQSYFSGITHVNNANYKSIADETNNTLASLGINYKVTSAQVASVDYGMNNVVLPGMKSAEDGAVAANMQREDGPFADIFVA